jgi:phospholipid/cholesterol/gamma-HCH transport system substrate-binding protein
VKISKEFKVGFTFITAVLIFVWGFNLLKGTDMLSKGRYFYAVYNRVDGLTPDNRVLINGLAVGKVSRLTLMPETNKILVEIYLRDEIQIPENSIARIHGTDLLGSKAIEIQLGNAKQYAVSYDTLQSEVEQALLDQVNEQVEPLKLKAIALINSVDSVMSVIQSIFNEGTRSNLHATIERITNILINAERTTSTLDTILSAEKIRVRNIMKNIESISTNLEANNENINSIFTNLAILSDSLASAEIPQTMHDAQDAIARLNAITDKINDGDGTIGQLLTNDSLYIYLENSTNSLNLLLEDIRENPKKYVKFSIF